MAAHVLELKPARAAGRHLHAANDPAPIAPPEFQCPSCGTRYFEAQPCDWCPTEHDVLPISTPAN